MKKIKLLLAIFTLIIAPLTLYACVNQEPTDLATANLSIEVSVTDEVFNSDDFVPTITLKHENKELKINQHFNLSITKTTASLKIKFIGVNKYKGEKTITFDLNQAKTYTFASDNKDFVTYKSQDGKVEMVVKQSGEYNLKQLLTQVEKGDTIIISRNILKQNSTDNTGYVITKPISVIGAQKENGKYKIEGIFRVQMADKTEILPARIENLEISHSGRYVKDSTDDERRGILVLDGSVEIINNYIHLDNENPTEEEKLPNAPTGIQLSVRNHQRQDELTYVVRGNVIGKYAKSVTSTSYLSTSILVDYDEGQVVNISFDQVYEIYQNNTFHNDSEAIIVAFDYRISKYTAGVFKDQTVISETYILEGLEYAPVGYQNRVKLVQTTNQE